MIKVRIDYATKSSKYPRFSKELDFTDEKHLQNYLDKANREGKKIIGHEIISDPCVWYVSDEDYNGPSTPPLNFAREYGKKYTIQEFQDLFNTPPELSEVNQTMGYIVFDNIK